MADLNHRGPLSGRTESSVPYPFSVWAGPDGLRDGDYRGDASRFGVNARKNARNLCPARSTAYVGAAEAGFPVKLSEHVLPMRVNAHHKARGGSFGAIVDACRDGRMSLSDIGDPKLRRKVAAKL